MPFVVFEGIDGSGKTTISNRVAAALRGRGLRVAHVREGGKFVSSVTQAIRELGRDARNLEMTPRTELLLFAARDAQLLEEATLPALAENDVVFADRFLYTAEVLARHGRGLPAEEVTPIVRGAARGVEPDLVILVDVDPHVARARRRVAKIITPDPRPSSRKGLGGVGMQHRLREGYRELAAADPGRWLVIDNSEAPLDDTVVLLTGVVETLLRQGREPAVTRGRAGLAPPPAHRAVTSPTEALAAFLDWIDRRASSEPALAAYFLAGLYGPGIDERRETLAERAPEVVAHAVRSLTDPVSVRLRRALVARAPGLVARSLAALAGEGDEAYRLRDTLAARVPIDVAASLDGRDDDRAWNLRERLWSAAADAVVGSVKRIPTPRAWTLRDRWLGERGGESTVLAGFEATRALCESLGGVDDDRAWDLRRGARETAPVPALASLSGLTSERAWKWRRRWLERAPKVILRTIAGLDDEPAWELREASAARVKEAIDSMVGLADERAWRLRESCADVWPSTVVKSLGPLAATPRGEALVQRQLAMHPGNLSLLKHASAVALGTDVALSTEAE